MADRIKIQDNTKVAITGKVSFTDYDEGVLELDFDSAHQISIKTSDCHDQSNWVFFDKEGAKTLAQKLLAFAEGI